MQSQSGNKFLEKFLTIPENVNPVKRKLILGIRVIYASLKRFTEDNCLMVASGISYTTIVSLVPTLTVALALLTISSGYTEKQELISETITTFLQKNEIRIDITPYLETLKDIVSSATQIGAVGFIVLIFSATAILRTFEAAFNQIWRIKVQRPFSDKIIFYFFILSVGPLLFVIILGFALKFSDFVRHSHLYSVSMDSKNYLWIAGERGTLIKIDQSGKKYSKLSDLKIDFENMECLDIKLEKPVNICDAPDLKKEDFIKLRNKSKMLYAASRKGILLVSEDAGDSWKISQFLNTEFKDVSVGEDQTVYIITESGEIIRYSREKYIKKIILKSADTKSYALRVKIHDKNLSFLLDSTGNVWTSRDGGEVFTPKNLSVNRLEDIEVFDEKTYFIVGEKGGIFRTTDAGENWDDLSHKNITFTKVWNFTDGKDRVILILNNFDQLLVSSDMGENWTLSYSPENGSLQSITGINPRLGFKAMNPEDEEGLLEDILHKDADKQNSKDKPKEAVGDLLAVGEFNKIAVGDIFGGQVVWKTLSGGDRMFSLYSIIRFIIPLVAIWTFFFMLYSLIPNAKVPIRPAVVGSFLTSVIFLLFIYGYSIYIRSFSDSTLVIYRALAAIPLLLLSIYCISLIILLGAEITATLQYRDRYADDANFLESAEQEKNYSFYKSLKLLLLLYGNQKNKMQPLSLSSLQKELKLNGMEFSKILDALQKEKLIVVGNDNDVVPSLSSADLDVYEIMKIIAKTSMDIPPDEVSEKLAGILKNEILKIENYSKENLKKIRLADLV